MAIMASDNGDNFEATPMGMQQGVCSYIADVGMQETEYEKVKMIKHQVIVFWELTEKMTDGRPFMISKWYTLSLHEKAALRHDLENWRGKVFTEEELKGFDLEKLKGVNCLLNLVANTKGKAKVASVNPLPKGMSPITIINETPSEKFMAFIDRVKAKAVLPTHADNQAGAENTEGLPF